MTLEPEMASDMSAPVSPISTHYDHPPQFTNSITSPDPHNVAAKATARHEQAPRIGGAVLDIIWAMTCLSLPMLVLTAIFIGLVYGYEVSNNDSSSDLLGASISFPSGSAYYVDYSATRLLTISSWTSTVASFTTTFVMVLVSYPLAKSFCKKSASGVVDALPTTYQLNLIIGLISGGWGPLWQWLQYFFWKGRAKQPGLLWFALLSMLGGTALSLAILGADTWLHVVTTSVDVDIILPRASQATASYGRTLSLPCYNSTFEVGDLEQCIGKLSPPDQYIFYNASEASQTVMNLSTDNVALSATIDGQNFAYLTSARRTQNLDYQADTFAMSTTCTPASTLCALTQESICLDETGCLLGQHQKSLAMTYQCGANLTGNINNNTGFATDTTDGSSFGSSSNIGFFIQTFRKPNFSDPIGTASGQTETPNPFYFAVGAAVSTSAALTNDPEMISDDLFFNKAFIFDCTTTIYELSYASVGGSVSGGNYTKANATLSNNVGWTIYHAQALTHNTLESAIISGAQQTSTSQDFGDFFAREFSKGMISMTSAITDPKTNTAEQTRETKLVTHLPKVPFFFLIVLNLLFAVLGIVLAAIALASHPRRTRNLQARLSTAGLVAALLEPSATSTCKKGTGIESVFAEYYNRGQPAETGRVMLVDSVTDNGVFEKLR
jgi:hypothetical protein